MVRVEAHIHALVGTAGEVGQALAAACHAFFLLVVADLAAASAVVDVTGEIHAAVSATGQTVGAGAHASDATLLCQAGALATAATLVVSLQIYAAGCATGKPLDACARCALAAAQSVSGTGRRFGPEAALRPNRAGGPLAEGQ